MIDAEGAQAPVPVVLDGITFEPDAYAGERASADGVLVGEIEWDETYEFHKARRIADDERGEWLPVRSLAEGRAFIVGKRRDLYPGIPLDQRPTVPA